ncbi:MAG TPA: prolyl oligopeptidase family serine peptidase, partial [Vicinamibacteria bacterium]|nr:prolyl oligopeptidase family serine peptidase [Vicinamibacteria bacterium]
LKQVAVLGGFDPSRYRVEVRHATAPDGVKVPYWVLFRKDLKRDGSGAAFLNAYGSYGSSSSAGFSSNVFSLVDRGVVYAMAYIRGGGELGKKWHDEGRMLKKKNTFTDFIAVAEHLVASKYTSSDRLAISGGSAGGLLMGAVVNMRPDLFKAVIARVPFVDVIHTMLDETLPLTVAEFEEWGNPRIAEQYHYMKSYSPYDNVAAKAYPAMLVKTSYNDSQVMYWEPAKWVAKLRATRTDRNPLLFHINMDPAGHSGRSGRYDRLREVAFDYAFLLWQLGVEKGEGAPPTMAAVLAATVPADWRPLRLEDTLYLQLPAGRVVIELAPSFAPRHAENIKALVREGYFDGLAIVRVQDNYVTQWGDPDGDDEQKRRKVLKAQRTLPAEFSARFTEAIPFTVLPDKDGYAPVVGFSNGFHAWRDPAEGTAGLAHCYGTVGVGRGNEADSGGGTSLYAVIGHGPRHLDRNITVVGRVVQGMDLLSSLPRGTGNLGFYEKPEQRLRITSVKMAGDVPAPERTALEVMRTDTAAFARLVESRRNRREEWYKRPAGHVELCNVPLPVRPAK